MPPLFMATGFMGTCRAELSALLPLLENPLKSGPMLPSGRVTLPPCSRSAAGFSLMLISLDRSLPASCPLAVSGPVEPPLPQAVSARAAAMAAAPPILFRFLMVFPSLVRVVLVMGRINLGCMVFRRVVDHQHVLVQFPVGEEAGETLVRCRRRGLPGPAPADDGATASSGGSRVRHFSCFAAGSAANTGQRVAKLQPLGASSGDGRSPLRMMRSRVRSRCGSGTGMADSRARV